jgi:hypothetical protein
MRIVSDLEIVMGHLFGTATDVVGSADLLAELRRRLTSGEAP